MLYTVIFSDGMSQMNKLNLFTLRQSTFPNLETRKVGNNSWVLSVGFTIYGSFSCLYKNDERRKLNE